MLLRLRNYWRLVLKDLLDKKHIMRKLVYVLIITVIIGCKEGASSEATNEDTFDTVERTEKQNDGLTLLKGQFIYYADAAVLQTHREVYGVVINEKMHELDEMTKKYKNSETDMVPVEVRGKISAKPENEEGWPFRVEIVEILNVSAPDPNAGEMITIGKE